MASEFFEGNTPSSSGLLIGQYLWSNPNNWSSGTVPAIGGSVTLAAVGVDDIGSLSLSSLIESGGNYLHVSGASLAIGILTTSSGFELYAGILGVSSPVTVSAGSVVGSGSILGAVGGTFIDLSISDPGEHYFAGYGGAVTLHAAPASTSILEFGGGYADTIALAALPAGTYGATIAGVEAGDVLELPGSGAIASFGATSFTVTTSAGAFGFSNVDYGFAVDAKTATFNAAAGLDSSPSPLPAPKPSPPISLPAPVRWPVIISGATRPIGLLAWCRPAAPASSSVPPASMISPLSA